MRLQTLAEARWILAILFFLALVSCFFNAWLFLFFFVLILYTLFFFRDPDRNIPADRNAVLAAADGTVTDISEVEESEVLKTRMRRVGIFLSIFDVHTNRAPIEGRIINRQHREGLCLHARRAGCSAKNEPMTWAVDSPGVTSVVRQITGASARRLVAW